MDEFLHDLNAKQAAIRAGYATKDADVTGSRLLSHVGVARAIEEAKARRATRTIITAEKVVDELAILAHSDPTHYMVGPEGGLVLAAHAPRGAMRAISSMKHKRTTIPGRDGAEPTVIHEVEFKLWDKPGMIKLAGRHVAVTGFSDRVEHVGKDGGPIQYENLTIEEKRAKVKELLEAGASRVATEGDGPSGS